MSKLDFKTAVEQEEARLRLLHPTPSDVPGCISVFDDYISCSGKQSCSSPCSNTNFIMQSDPVSSQVHLQVWPSG